MVRMRGLEPPRGIPHNDLNVARLPVPPHPHTNTRRAVKLYWFGACPPGEDGSEPEEDCPGGGSSSGIVRDSPVAGSVTVTDG